LNTPLAGQKNRVDPTYAKARPPGLIHDYLLSERRFEQGRLVRKRVGMASQDQVKALDLWCRHMVRNLIRCVLVSQVGKADPRGIGRNLFMDRPVIFLSNVGSLPVGRAGSQTPQRQEKRHARAGKGLGA